VKREVPDVVCFQELCEKDIAFLSEALSLPLLGYAPRSDIELTPGERVIEGIGIFSRLKVKNVAVEYYSGDAGHLPRKSMADRSTYPLANHGLISVDLEKEGVLFRIATTHFTWTKDGRPNETQRKDMQELLRLLETKGEIVVVGDFNTSRGGEMFSALAARYTDNIPAHYATSIDVDMHRAGRERMEADARALGVPGHMVDGLFTTPTYHASNVRLERGISDHYAIVATISRAS
jgi:endonuclease/exonuclease/phosphatase family metal-dependent hydrolase